MTLVLSHECDSHDRCCSLSVTVMAVVLSSVCAFMAVLLFPVDGSHVCDLAWCSPLSLTVLSVFFLLWSRRHYCSFSPSAVVILVLSSG